jgi:hypothetical protein
VAYCFGLPRAARWILRIWTVGIRIKLLTRIDSIIFSKYMAMVCGSIATFTGLKYTSLVQGSGKTGLALAGGLDNMVNWELISS